MSESGDFDPGHWRGHDFAPARKHYDRHVSRSYEDAVTASKPRKDVLCSSLKTESRAPLLFRIDETGSMGKWTAVIFEKLGYLELEGQEYLGEDMEISFGAFGDAYSDQYPLQIRPFTKGVDLKKRLEELVIEGNGGGQAQESAELVALYDARNVEMPKAKNPIWIIITDESPYDFVNKDHARDHAGINIQAKHLSTEEVFKELKRKYAVYLIRKPYGDRSQGDGMDSLNQRIHQDWAELVGEDHISVLPEAQRVVDVVFGILAKETGRIDYFREEIEGRQKPDQVKTVYKALHTVHKLTGPESRLKLPGPGKSIMHKPTKRSSS